MTKIKICGLFRPVDIDYVNEAMPDYIGFVFAKSKRQITEDQATMLQRKLNSGISTIGVFVNEPLENVVRLLRNGVIDVAQLHGGENESYIQQLKSQIDKPIIKVLRIQSRKDIEDAENTSADFLLLDNGAGGTGMSFDWSFIGKIEIPFFLAGGLNIKNITQAINTVKPYAVDLSSGVETDGVKDKTKIIEIVRRIRNV